MSLPLCEDGADFKCAPVFKEMKQHFKQNGANIAKKVQGVFVYKVTKGPGGKIGIWVVDAKNGNGSVKYGESDQKGDVMITMTDDDVFKLMTNRLNPQQAYFQGKLQIDGNMGLAYKFRELQPKSNKSKL